MAAKPQPGMSPEVLRLGRHGVALDSDEDEDDRAALEAYTIDASTGAIFRPGAATETGRLGARTPTVTATGQLVHMVSAAARVRREYMLGHPRGVLRGRQSTVAARQIRAGARLNLSHIRFVSGRTGISYQCDGCGGRTQRTLRHVCQAWRCEGRREPFDSAQWQMFDRTNHYVSRYLCDDPMSAVAREHTAAIGTERREAIEEMFREGRVNLLNCTTTMEMGVDLGDPEAVLCRNVPPEIAKAQGHALGTFDRKMSQVEAA